MKKMLLIGLLSVVGFSVRGMNPVVPEDMQKAINGKKADYTVDDLKQWRQAIGTAEFLGHEEDVFDFEGSALGAPAIKNQNILQACLDVDNPDLECIKYLVYDLTADFHVGDLSAFQIATDKGHAEVLKIMNSRVLEFIKRNYWASTPKDLPEYLVNLKDHFELDPVKGDIDIVMNEGADSLRSWLYGMGRLNTQYTQDFLEILSLAVPYQTDKNFGLSFLVEVCVDGKCPIDKLETFLAECNTVDFSTLTHLLTGDNLGDCLENKAKDINYPDADTASAAKRAQEVSQIVGHILGASVPRHRDFYDFTDINNVTTLILHCTEDPARMSELFEFYRTQKLAVNGGLALPFDIDTMVHGGGTLAEHIEGLPDSPQKTAVLKTLQLRSRYDEINRLVGEAQAAPAKFKEFKDYFEANPCDLGLIDTDLDNFDPATGNLALPITVGHIPISDVDLKILAVADPYRKTKYMRLCWLINDSKNAGKTGAERVDVLNRLEKYMEVTQCDIDTVTAVTGTTLGEDLDAAATPAADHFVKQALDLCKPYRYTKLRRLITDAKGDAANLQTLRDFVTEYPYDIDAIDEDPLNPGKKLGESLDEDMLAHAEIIKVFHDHRTNKHGTLEDRIAEAEAGAITPQALKGIIDACGYNLATIMDGTKSLADKIKEGRHLHTQALVNTLGLNPAPPPPPPGSDPDPDPDTDGKQMGSPLLTRKNVAIAALVAFVSYVVYTNFYAQQQPKKNAKVPVK